ncbi:MAG: hypothetical protein GC206_02665 [Alphaproteobacteria bacterium]|nr:hypothetical protein [Alphaproteobacteria bacterium]
MRIAFLALPLAALALASVATAEDSPARAPHQRPDLRAADANGDGAVSRAEFTAAHAARFAQMDANGDGVIDASERPARRRGPPRDGAAAPPAGAQEAGARPPRGMRPDADGDGRITRAEFDASLAAMFDHIDANDDGAIAGEEFERRRHRGRRPAPDAAE